MKITKVINNNIVRSVNGNMQEVLLIGKALGFQKKIGDLIDTYAIEKTYILVNQDQENELLEMLSTVDFSNVQVVNKIIDMAEKKLGKELPTSVYFSLLDHISFAIDRFHKGLLFENKLHNEIKRFYSIEYSIGENAVQIINDNLEVSLPIDESSFIAMHILNAQLDNNYFDNTDFMTKIIKNSIEIAKRENNITFETESVSYERFITHLKFFSTRLLKGEKLKSVNPNVLNVIIDEYHEAYTTALLIRDYIHKSHGLFVEDAEIMYLAIHINTFINRNL